MKRNTPLSELSIVFIIVSLLVGLACPFLNPLPAEAAAPDQPSNESPVDGAIEISRTHTLKSSAFDDGDSHTHYASQWQITNDSGDYSSPAFDSGVDPSNKVSIAVPHGVIYTNTTYYWRVRHIDSAGEQSQWSDQTSFRTIVSAKPITPVNGLPSNGAIEMALSPTLTSSPFASPDGGATHGASRWQVATDGSFGSIVYDSGTETSNLASITITLGTLSSSTTYYWRVKYQDNYGDWSEWSTGTSFATAASTTPPEAITPNTPSNVAPVNGAEDIILTPDLRASAFSPDTSKHTASRWQITSTPGVYDGPVYDSGVSVSQLTKITVPPGALSYDTEYHWRVRYQDDYGNWSDWSAETSFTTLPPLPPNGPANVEPANGSTDIGLTPYLESSEFSDPDVDDNHAASHWQVTTISDDYTDPVFSSENTSGLVRMAVPPGKLDYNTQYYWRVKYRDRYGMWSKWSTETSFTTLASQAPRQPTNIAPSDAAQNVASLMPTLQVSAFSDPDARDEHIASWWQITNVSEDYSSPVYDSGLDTSSLTQAIVPEGMLQYDTTYYWRARYQDRHDNWSAWSVETSFSTVALQANFSATPSEIEVGDAVTLVDLSTGDANSWTWDFGDGNGVEWTTITKPEDGRQTWIYAEPGSYSISLTVTGPSGNSTKTRIGYVNVLESAAGGAGVPLWTWLAIGLLIALVGSYAVIRLRRRP